MRVNPDNGCGERRNVKGPISVANVGAVAPDMGFADKCGAPSDPKATREREGHFVVWSDIKVQRWNGLHEYEFLRCAVCCDV